MKNNITIERVGTIKFGEYALNVYNSLDEPLFMASELNSIFGYNSASATQLMHLVEEDEKVQVSGNYKLESGKMNYQTKWFVTELGLYNILAQSRKQIARSWRRIVHDELINLRRSRSMDIIQQFASWDERLDALYVDPETGILMESVTVEGGDVIQVKYEPDEEVI